MADLESGHLFLTYVIPIRRGGPRNDVSFKQKLRIELARLPPAHQTPATQKTEYAAPFARNRRTHFARMFVLDNVVYNGRNGQDALVGALRNVGTLTPQHVDGLRSAYLVFTADVDAVIRQGDPLPDDLDPEAQRRVRMAYARTLWDTMGEEIAAIFGNCHGFEGVSSGEAFGAYLERCHVETTMPFHDYYLVPPEFHVLPVRALALAVLIPGGIALGALLLRILGLEALFGLNTLLLAVAAFLVTLLAFVLAVRHALRNGARPLAPARHDDLPSVLKALYIQQAFADFVAEHQGRDAGALAAGFGAFLDRNVPADPNGPTQRPGVIASDAPQPRARV